MKKAITQASIKLHNINLRECRSAVLCAGAPRGQVRHTEVQAPLNDGFVVLRVAQTKLLERIKLAADPECTDNSSFIL